MLAGLESKGRMDDIAIDIIEIEARFRIARERGELKPDADPAVLASATMHTIAIRARARGAELSEVARKAVSVIRGGQVEAN